MGRARTGQSLYEVVTREMQSLHILRVDTLQAHYRRTGRHCTYKYLALVVANLERAGKLKRIRKGEYLVIHAQAA